jgi:hypothetical protein
VANKGINNAQDVLLNQGPDAIAAHTMDDVFHMGTALPPSQWYGFDQPVMDYNLTDNSSVGLEAGLKITHGTRDGASILPTGSGPNGERFYTVPSGVQPNAVNNFAPWSLDYIVNTAPGVVQSDIANLASRPTLADFDVKLAITQANLRNNATGLFVSPKTAIFDLNAVTHVWTDEKNPSVSFGGDDFAGPIFGLADAEVRSHVAESSVSLHDLIGDFGQLAVKHGTSSNAIGVTYDIKLAVFDKGTPHLESFTHDFITVL